MKVTPEMMCERCPNQTKIQETEEAAVVISENMKVMEINLNEGIGVKVDLSLEKRTKDMKVIEINLNVVIEVKVDLSLEKRT